MHANKKYEFNYVSSYTHGCILDINKCNKTNIDWIIKYIKVVLFFYDRSGYGNIDCGQLDWNQWPVGPVAFW